MGGTIDRVLVEFHPGGSLATTHESQGSDMGLFGGLLGWDADHERLVESATAIREAGIEVEIRITDFPAFHPNTYRISLWGGGTEHRLTALSTGGGIIQVTEIDGIGLTLSGDSHEVLLFLLEGDARKAGADGFADRLATGLKTDEVSLHAREEAAGVDTTETESRPGTQPTSIVRARVRGFPSLEDLEGLLEGEPVSEVRFLSPVLPIRSPKNLKVPFLTAGEMQSHDEDRGTELWRLAVEYESARGGIGEEEVLATMAGILDVMEQSVAHGLAGTDYQDRILRPQTGLFQDRLDQGALIDVGLLNKVILYVSAIMEVKSSMGVVVAAPTAGSCGALPASVLGAGHARGSGKEEMVRAMMVAGIIGVFIAARSTFAAEVCGCQAECGAGSGMAAAALVSLAGGSTSKALAAASMAIQNTLGMICDPVANRVEVPCLGRNVLAASNALASANLALAGFDEVIPLDEVIQAADEVGRSLPHELRCTALGGLSVTDTSKTIEERLREG
jgi:L-serine dehydratase